jgi:hypothetical protein
LGPLPANGCVIITGRSTSSRRIRRWACLSRKRLSGLRVFSADNDSVSGRFRPLGDSRQHNLHAGKRPFITDGARFTRRLAGVGMSRLGEGRKNRHFTCILVSTHPAHRLSVRSRTHVTKTLPPSSNQMAEGQGCVSIGPRAIIGPHRRSKCTTTNAYTLVPRERPARAGGANRLLPQIARWMKMHRKWMGAKSTSWPLVASPDCFKCASVFQDSACPSHKATWQLPDEPS